MAIQPIICLLLAQALLFSASEVELEDEPIRYEAEDIGPAPDFRVAHGFDVNMRKDDFQHLVLIIRFKYTGNNYTSDICTGMKVHRKQLTGEPFASFDIVKPNKAEPDKPDVHAGFVLTAGHCVMHEDDGKRTDIGQEMFVIDDLDKVPIPTFEKPTFKGAKAKVSFHVAKEVNVKRVIRHAHYMPSANWGHDLAILKPEADLRAPAFKLQYDKITIFDKKKDCRFAGFGVDERGRFGGTDGHTITLRMVDPATSEMRSTNNCWKKAKELMETEASISEKFVEPEKRLSDDQKRCFYAVVRARNFNVDDPVQLCTYHTNGSTSCGGDSGGPLMCKSKVGDKTTETVWGVLSGGITRVGIKKVYETQVPEGEANWLSWLGDTCKAAFTSKQQKQYKKVYMYSHTTDVCQKQSAVKQETAARYSNLAHSFATEWLKRCVKVVANPKSSKEDQTYCNVKQWPSIVDVKFTT